MAITVQQISPMAYLAWSLALGVLQCLEVATVIDRLIPREKLPTIVRDVTHGETAYDTHHGR